MSLSNSQWKHRSQNRWQQCEVGGCYKPRHQSSQYCANHARRQQYYGHAEGYRIKKKDLAPFLKSVKRFFRKHKEHPAIVESIKVLDEWLYEGVILASNGGGKACQELRRLYDSGIRGKDVLEVAGAVWLMSHHLPAMIPDDERLTFALSRAILQTCPQTERITGFSSTGEAKRSHNRAGATVHRVVGQFIRDSIGIVYYRMFEAMARDTEREKQQRQDRKHRLRMPFVNGTEDGP
ncbi:MAG: hypothetical protein IPK79_13190 [Vampirovibrionales bacterium]|nr:hypothetical protein [Vampirovibrionales bacterium]